jgi:hypothetical protein
VSHEVTNHENKGLCAIGGKSALPIEMNWGGGYI